MGRPAKRPRPAETAAPASAKKAVAGAAETAEKAVKGGEQGRRVGNSVFFDTVVEQKR